eukprot:TRINITY_DN9742_c0_g1_i1.p1 TRINITY_DN9742_c0_g1~~TRINITY_DN9742_c0_g1_i1.p1  ORF type:complete len:249 (+),score=69.27 TRINITY_DN9742_c0_g1_i1:91-837(+)
MADAGMRQRFGGPARPPSRQPHNTGQNPEWEAVLGQPLQFFVRQQVEVLEAMTGFETENAYEIMAPGPGPHGWVRWGWAAEESNVCLRNILGNRRPFKIAVTDSQQRNVINMQRPWQPCLASASVYDGSGARLGEVSQRCSLCHREFDVNLGFQTEYRIEGPCWRPWTFHIKSGGVEVGRIAKKFSGLAQELMTDADDFGIDFPADASPQAKAVLLSALFLIDFCYFEEKGNGEVGGRRQGPHAMYMH